MLDQTARPKTGGEALLMALKASGIDYLFANAGTDFPPIIEGLVQLSESDAPTPITVAHETAGMAMAHGHWLVTGRPQAVMVHVNVGLANAVMGVINAVVFVFMYMMVLRGGLAKIGTKKVKGNLVNVKKARAGNVLGVVQRLPAGG